MSTLIVYGSTTGNTEKVANLISENINHDATVVEVTDVNLDDIKSAELVLFGSSTWGYGDLQDDFEGFIDNIDSDLVSGKKVAVFGCGDEDSYPDVFCEATEIIKNKLEEAGASLVAEPLKVDGDPEDNEDAIIEFAVSL